jgi:hypothetical protein
MEFKVRSYTVLGVDEGEATGLVLFQRVPAANWDLHGHLRLLGIFWSLPSLAFDAKGRTFLPWVISYSSRLPASGR